METQPYTITRYSLIPSSSFNEQLTFNLEKGGAFSKEQAFEKAIFELEKNIHKDIYIERDDTKTHYMLYFSERLGKDTVVLQFAKEKTVVLNKVTESKIEAQETPDFPNTSIIINLKKQYCFIQENRKLSSSINSIARAFSKCMNKLFDELYLFIIIEIELITSAANFWNIVKENDGYISYAEFQLISPNFLGMDYETTEMLKVYQEANNNEKLTIGFENSKGKLKLFTEWIQELIKYISNGCGIWRLKVKGKRPTITSENNPISIPLPDSSDISDKEAKKVLDDALAKIERIENENKIKSKESDDSN